MVAYLKKPKGSEAFHQIMEFLNTSHIKYALIENPKIYISLIQQFWGTTIARTTNDGEVEITDSIDGQIKTITELSIIRHLKLEDSNCITSLPNTKIFEQLALMGHVSDSDLEDPSKQGMRIGEIDQNPSISLVQDEGTSWIQEDVEIQGKTTKQLQEEFDRATQEQEVVVEADQAHDIDWSNPAMLRYHALQNRSFSIAEVRKNMCMYLKNQGGYKQSHFKGMSYKDIRPIFEREWSKIMLFCFIPKDSNIEKEVMKRLGFDFQQKSSKKRSREDSDEDNAKKQKLEDDAEKEELRDKNMMYYQIIKADGSSKNYKIFSEMLDDFDRQDVLDLHRLVQERYDTTSPEGYDLLLWGDMKILFEPNEEDEIWKNQQDYNLISWRLFDSCGIHMLLMHTGIAIHMMIEKKYPLTQEMLSRMLSRRLKVSKKVKWHLNFSGL
ncbi:hypothetical protein Tco_1072371 [Tanacetum coccineum]